MKTSIKFDYTLSDLCDNTEIVFFEKDLTFEEILLELAEKYPKFKEANEGQMLRKTHAFYIYKYNEEQKHQKLYGLDDVILKGSSIRARLKPIVGG